MVVTVTKTTDDVASTAIPHAELKQLCADDDGCTIELGLTGYDFDGADSSWDPLTTPYIGMPCRFFLDGTTGAWSISPHCHQEYAIYDSYPPGSLGDLGYLRSYASGIFGTDGEDYGGSDNWSVMLYLKLCAFAEAGPVDTVTDGVIVDTDDAEGFYLIASDENWWDVVPGDSTCPDEPDACWTGSPRTCIMIVQD